MTHTHRKGTSAPLKLPLWPTIFESWCFPLARFGDLARLGSLPLLLLLATGLVFGSFDAAPAGDIARDSAGPVILKGLLAALVQGVIAAVFLVAWHRLVMRDYAAAAVAAGPFAGMTRRASLYFLQMLLLSLLFLAVWLVAFMAVEVPAIFTYLAVTTDSPERWLDADPGADPDHAAGFVVLGYAALLIGLLPAFYVALRLSLVLPATAAVERRGRFGRAWRVSAGNGWRMVGATVLAILPVEFFNLAVGFFARVNAGKALHYPLVLLAGLGMLYLMAVMGTVLSRCYAFAESNAAVEITETTPVPAAG